MVFPLMVGVELNVHAGIEMPAVQFSPEMLLQVLGDGLKEVDVVRLAVFVDHITGRDGSFESVRPGYLVRISAV